MKMFLTSPDHERSADDFDNALTFPGQLNVFAYASTPPSDTASRKLPSSDNNTPLVNPASLLYGDSGYLTTIAGDILKSLCGRSLLKNIS